MTIKLFQLLLLDSQEMAIDTEHALLISLKTTSILWRKAKSFTSFTSLLMTINMRTYWLIMTSFGFSWEQS